MIPFHLYKEAMVLSAVLGALILIPCLLVFFIGRGLINELGQYPSKSPLIHMSILIKIIPLQVLTFFALFGFLNVFTD